METVPTPPRSGKARCFVRINGDPYAARKLRANHWTLTRPDGLQTYHCQRVEAGIYSCTCPDHKHRGIRCKHLGALLATGLLTRPRRKAVADV